MAKQVKKSPAKKSAKPAAKSKPVAKAKPAAKPVMEKSAAPVKVIAKAPPKKIIKAAVKPAPKKAAPKPVVKAVVKPLRKPGKPYKKVKLPEGYKPNEKEEYMSAMQVEYFRQKLEDWKRELSRELSETLDNLKEENWQEPDITDRATVETDTGIELRTRDRYRKLINKINSALNRIDRGEYGHCEETGDEIGIKRLAARPIATMTVEAQERHERDERTHYDEDMEERA